MGVSIPAILAAVTSIPGAIAAPIAGVLGAGGLGLPAAIAGTAGTIGADALLGAGLGAGEQALTGGKPLKGAEFGGLGGAALGGISSLLGGAGGAAGGATAGVSGGGMSSAAGIAPARGCGCRPRCGRCDGWRSLQRLLTRVKLVPVGSAVGAPPLARFDGNCGSRSRRYSGHRPVAAVGCRTRAWGRWYCV